MTGITLALRIADALVDHGGAITRPDVVGYLADLLGADVGDVLDALAVLEVGGLVVTVVDVNEATVARPEAA